MLLVFDCVALAYVVATLILWLRWNDGGGLTAVCGAFCKRRSKDGRFCKVCVFTERESAQENINV